MSPIHPGQGWKRWLHVHYVAEIVSITGYALFRTVFLRHDDYTYSRVDDADKLWQWEKRIMQIMGTTLLIRVIKAHTLEEGVSTVLSVLKLACVALTFTMDWRLCWAYLLFLGLLMVLFPSPGYTGPDNVWDLTPKSLKEFILQPPESQKQTVTWLVHMHKRGTALYAHEQPLFAEVSLEYAHAQLQFAKVDVDQWPLVQKVLGCSVDQQPVVLRVEGGKVVDRYPEQTSSSWLPPPKLKKEEWVTAFKLQEHAPQAAAAETAVEQAAAVAARPVLPGAGSRGRQR